MAASGDNDRVQFHVVGDALVDVLAAGLQSLPSSWGDDVNAGAISAHAGGSAVNTAVHLASILGSSGTVFFHGCIGDDSFGRELRGSLERAGVVPNLTILAGCPTGSCIVLSGEHGRSFVTCAGATGAMSASHIPGVADALRKATGRFHVHFAGFYAYGPLRREVGGLVRELRQEAATRGVVVTASADINGSEALHVAGFDAVLPALDLFKANKEEAEAVAKKKGCSVESVARFLAEGARCVVVTDGGSGATFCKDGVAGHAPAKAVQVQDTTGAGDACAAALLAAWVCGDALDVAVVRGCAAGSANCMRIGGCSMPVTSEEIETLLRFQ
eukprot:TRINITY_DN61262_c0_g1_i1.p1 TRINITY_DN61262_c0_g1~~TRINITY_DN61262_c0_g1_i1.p1  ORF type:complete len:342 (-),score=49.67 TRINITY_DN61262_c0_g1_i1:45-1034(-)